MTRQQLALLLIGSGALVLMVGFLLQSHPHAATTCYVIAIACELVGVVLLTTGRRRH